MTQIKLSDFAELEVVEGLGYSEKIKINEMMKGSSMDLLSQDGRLIDENDSDRDVRISSYYKVEKSSIVIVTKESYILNHF